MNYKLLVFALGLLIGYLVAQVGDPVIHEALAGQEPDPRLLGLTLILGVGIGYIHIRPIRPVGTFLHVKRTNPAVLSIVRRAKPLTAVFRSCASQRMVGEISPVCY